MKLPDLGRHALDVAPRLLGARLVSDVGGVRTEVRLRIGRAGFVVGHYVTENRVAARRVAAHREDVRVIGSNQDEGFVEVDLLQCRLDRTIEFLGLDHRITGLADVVAVIDPAAFDHQKVAVIVDRQQVYRFRRHLRE